MWDGERAGVKAVLRWRELEEIVPGEAGVGVVWTGGRLCEDTAQPVDNRPWTEGSTGFLGIEINWIWATLDFGATIRGYPFLGHALA